MSETGKRDAKIFAAVRRIPRGRVASYGDVAAMAGLPGYARQVGYALHRLPDGSRVPWHRVILSNGAIAPRAIPDHADWQRALLEREGVKFRPDGRVEMTRFRIARRR